MTSESHCVIVHFAVDRKLLIMPDKESADRLFQLLQDHDCYTSPTKRFIMIRDRHYRRLIVLNLTQVTFVQWLFEPPVTQPAVSTVSSLDDEVDTWAVIWTKETRGHHIDLLVDEDDETLAKIEGAVCFISHNKPAFFQDGDGQYAYINPEHLVLLDLNLDLYELSMEAAARRDGLA